MITYKYATIIHPTYSHPKVFCTDTNICQQLFDKVIKDYGRKPEVVRNDPAGNLLEFEINCGNNWFQASTWILQHLLDQGWEPFGVTSTENGHSSFLHLRLRVGNEN